MGFTDAIIGKWKNNRGIFMRDGIDRAIERLAWISWSGVFASPEQYFQTLYNNSVPAANLKIWLISAKIATDGQLFQLSLTKGHANDLRAVGMPLILGAPAPPGQLYTQQTGTPTNTAFATLADRTPEPVGIDWYRLAVQPIAVVPPGWSLAAVGLQANTNLTPLTVLYEWGA